MPTANTLAHPSPANAPRDAKLPASTAPAASFGVLRMRLLAWTFTLFNGLRTVSYLPNILQIVDSGQADQHSMLTWLCFTGANLSTAWWVWETNGRDFDRVVLISVANGLLCALTLGFIVGYRWF